MGTRTDSSVEFPVRLSRRLSLVQALILLAVLIAGGLALASAIHLSRINRLIDQEYTHALVADQVHVGFHRLVAAAEQIEAAGGLGRLGRLRETEESLGRQVEAVIGRQKDTGAPTDRKREDALIGELQRLLRESRTLTASLASLSREAQAQNLERLQGLAEQGARLATLLVDVHQEGIRNLLQVSQGRLRRIIELYVILLVVVVAVVIIAGLLGNRWITAPLRRLSQAARLIAEGHLETRVPISSRDEVGHLSHAFNVMAGRLQDREHNLRSAQEQLRRKIGETHALHQIGAEINALAEVDPILQWVVDKARDLSGAEAAALCLLSPSGDALNARARSGPDGIFRVSGGAPDPVPIGEPSADLGVAALEVFQPGRIQASLPAPLRRRETVIGVLVVGTTTPREFSSDDHTLVMSLATQAAIAIENARLYEEVQGLATLEERRRLAQELHDGLTQTVGLLHLKLQQLQGSLAGVVPAVAATALQEVTGIAESAYEEARQSIFDLNAMQSPVGLLSRLTEYVEGFRSQSGIAVVVEADMASPLDLPPTAEVQVVRIVQEALNNVRRHAGAKQAWVRVCRVDEWVQVTVEDDGRGWDPASLPKADRPHFGLQTMRERAESLGGTLDIDTAPGRGARIAARVPAAKQP